MSAFKQCATPAQKHTSKAIVGTQCDNCPMMCVIQRGRRIRYEEYWCDWLHQVVKPHEVSCERSR